MIFFSSIIPAISFINLRPNDVGEEDSSDDLLNEFNDPTDVINEELNNFNNNNSSSNVSYDGEFYNYEDYNEYDLNDVSGFDLSHFGKPMEIFDVVEINFNQEFIQDFYILSENPVGNSISDAMQKTLESYMELAQHYNYDIPESRISQITSYLQDNVKNDDYIVHIRWIFWDGFCIDTYGIYDYRKIKHIFDPVLNSFPKIHLAEEKTIHSVSNNTISSGVKGSIARTILLYTYIFNVKVYWLQIEYRLYYRYTITPVANGDITQMFDWSFSAWKILLHPIGILDQFAVSPKYGLPYIDFYFDFEKKGSSSSPIIQTTSHSGTRTNAFTLYSGLSPASKYSYVSFHFWYGFQYLWEERHLDSYISSSYATTITGVISIEFESVSQTTTDVILGVAFNVIVEVRNPNSYNTRCTLKINKNSLKKDGEEVLIIVPGTNEEYIYDFAPNQKKSFTFSFKPVLGGSITIQFDSSLKIYEQYYFIYNHDLKLSDWSELGPSRSRSCSFSLDINDDVPAFNITPDQIYILNYEKGFFEPGDNIYIEVLDVKNIGDLEAYTLDVDILIEGIATPVTSFSTTNIPSGGQFDMIFPYFILTSFGKLPATRGFYFRFSYTWFGKLDPLVVDMYDQAPVEISFDLIEPTLDFYIEDSELVGDRTIDGTFELDYKGNRLESFNYDIDTIKRELKLPPTVFNLISLSINPSIWQRYSYSSLTHRVIATPSLFMRDVLPIRCT